MPTLPKNLSPFIAAGLAAFSFAAVVDARDGADSVAAARAYLESLDGEKADQADQEFDDASRARWDGPGRRGPRFDQLTAEETAAAERLLKSALTETGYRKVRGCMRVEQAARRNDKAHSLAVWGPPRTNGPWTWRLEGHHVSLNITEVPGFGTSAMPLFLGAEPATVPEGHADAGYRPLAAEEDRALALVMTFDAEQRKKSVFSSPPPPKNVMFGHPDQKDPGQPIGLPFAQMNADQREKLLALVDAFTESFRGDVAARYRARHAEDGLDNLHFAWVGETKKGAFYYWRVQGPRFVMEFDHYNHDPNHIHMLWRDPADDMGAELLRRHKERFHPDAPKPPEPAPAPAPAKKKPKLY